MPFCYWYKVEKIKAINTNVPSGKRKIMSLRETVLQEALNIVKRNGLEGITEAGMIQKLGISQATFREIFSDLEDMVTQVMAYDSELQIQEHRRLLANSASAVEDLLFLLKEGIDNLKKTNPALFTQLQQHYPKAWANSLEHVNSYSYPKVHDILNKGVLEGAFRHDINIQLVTKIIFEQLYMMLNPVVFSPDRYNLAEVFRSIYLYYIRGLCTEKGAKIAEGFFSRNHIQ